MTWDLLMELVFPGCVFPYPSIGMDSLLHYFLGLIISQSEQDYDNINNDT